MSDNYKIAVSSEVSYVSSQSDPLANKFVFAYTITISNHGNLSARLIDRHWIITDSTGKIEEVKGEGVIGETPDLKPGESFQYTSGSMLETPTGSMEGSYGMKAEDGTMFKASIPLFTLSKPNSLH
ncbi:MAG: Co2+/Mg2+ efflux protein ApaG [Gammaproteobacteria bacterium]